MTHEITLPDYRAKTPEQLGPDADEHDVKAYNRELSAAWEANPPATALQALTLAEHVLQNGEWALRAARDRG